MFWQVWRERSWPRLREYFQSLNGGAGPSAAEVANWDYFQQLIYYEVLSGREDFSESSSSDEDDSGDEDGFTAKERIWNELTEPYGEIRIGENHIPAQDIPGLRAEYRRRRQMNRSTGGVSRRTAAGHSGYGAGFQYSQQTPHGAGIGTSRGQQPGGFGMPSQFGASSMHHSRFRAPPMPNSFANASSRHGTVFASPSMQRGSQQQSQHRAPQHQGHGQSRTSNASARPAAQTSRDNGYVYSSSQRRGNPQAQSGHAGSGVGGAPQTQAPGGGVRQRVNPSELNHLNQSGQTVRGARDRNVSASQATKTHWSKRH
jgi:hypothetical protein